MIIFACQEINMSIEWMSEDPIFIVKIEQYLEKTVYSFTQVSGSRRKDKK